MKATESSGGRCIPRVAPCKFSAPSVQNLTSPYNSDPASSLKGYWQGQTVPIIYFCLFKQSGFSIYLGSPGQLLGIWLMDSPRDCLYHWGC